jgi:SAM-dependent methyltransferase/MFS family permease
MIPTNKKPDRHRSALPLYAAPIFLSAFLLFLVQPIIAKQILPWFGGSAAVWATCMVFFQISLLAGYAYADWSTRRLAPQRQATLHIGLLLLSLVTLPIIPAASWKPTGAENPTWQILGLLAVTIGLPYLLLSTTTPLLQAWFARRYRLAIPYRLYALSNLASLLALLAYPFAVEPWASARIQSLVWSASYALLAMLIIRLAATVRLTDDATPVAVVTNATAAEAKPSLGVRLEWLAWSTMGSFMLLAVTNHLCQNVASVPFLWIAPLALYLASFIFAFDHPRWYRRSVFLPLLAVALPLMAYYTSSLDLLVVAPLFAGGLFVCCMVCHGELALSKPAPQFLTTFYLMMSIGGALGGLLVGFAAPYLLQGYYEISIGLVASAALLTFSARRLGRWALAIGVMVIALTTYAAGRSITESLADVRVMRRNFYGAIRTVEYSTPSRFLALMHGEIMHGGQYLDEDVRFEPNTYFARSSGFGRLFKSLPAGPRKIGVVGLGAGSILAFAQKGDEFCFYEINPQVVESARREFSFLSQGPAKTKVVLGDGRLSLEREPSQQFDVLALDAFSGDAIPLHLLTREAMAIYLKHLKPGGALIFQATNRFVNIAPAVATLAAEAGMTAVLITDYITSESEDTKTWWFCYDTDQIIVTANQELLNTPLLHDGGEVIEPRPEHFLWTDDYNNLFRALK